jgi:hypothetical protein
MKRMFQVASVGLLLVGLTGCSSGWPNLFCCNRNNEECSEVIEGGECGDSTNYYAPSDSAVQYVPAPSRTPTKVDELPMPGPDRSST